MRNNAGDLVRRAGVAVEFRAVTKRYGAVTALHEVSLSIAPGEFVSLLGPSGSGKSTLLMLLAGFEDPTAGDLLVDGRSVRGVPANRRDQGIVFQSYALFPHMTVAENLAFPLAARGIAPARQAPRVAAALDRVRMSGFAHRLPAQLSGGQQQRVALARAIVFDPPIILMDESLSALDRRLRQEMQLELKELHRQLGKTFVYVTHDQEEAVIMSDRIAVLHDGALMQVGTPREVYDRPADAFIAGFMGDANFLAGTVARSDGSSASVDLASGQLLTGSTAAALRPGDPATAIVRPEAVTLGKPDLSTMCAIVEQAIFVGDAIRYRVNWQGRTIDVKMMRTALLPSIEPGDRVSLMIDETRVRVVPA